MGHRTACGLILAASLAASPGAAGDIARAPGPGAGVACPGYGTGFVRLPGSGVCTRVSGRIAAGSNLRIDGTETVAVPTVAGRLAIDTRTETELGPVRTFVRIGNGRR